MNRPERVEETRQTEQRAHERLGYARCEAEQAERAVAELQKKRDLLQRQIEVVDAENRNLERELLQRLAGWRKLDDANQRVEEIMPQLKAVTSSLTYRGTAALLGVVNRARKLLRRGKPRKPS